MKYLITGGAGFIGSHFCYYMMKNHPDNDYSCVDVLTYAGSILNINDLLKNQNFHFYQKNICDKDFIFDLFKKEKFDYVINFAAETHVDRSIVNCNAFLETNVIGTQILLEACRINGVKRYHQVSTDEVYGDIKDLMSSEKFKEDSILKPSNPYSASKAAADLLTLSYYNTYHLPCTISRCSNNYGSYQSVDKFIPVIISSVINNKPIPIYGNGLNVRDWIFVDDHCQAIDKILSNGIDGEIYNVTSYCEKSNLDIVNIILKLLNAKKSLISYVPDRLGHDIKYAMEATKLLSLHWKPFTSFEDGIIETVNWYIDNKEWIEMSSKKINNKH